MKKYILVTGSSRGIGAAIALRFAKEGWHVFLNSHSSLEALKALEKEITEHTPGSCQIVAGDVKDPDQVRTMFQEIYQTCNVLDVLVNNAGIAHIGLLMDMTDDQWKTVLDTNLSSVFYCSREAMGPMISEKSGRIINISSMWGTVGASCEVAYSATKAGIHGLTKALAKELAMSNICVNAIACGVIDTQMNGQLTEEDKAALENDIPMGRFGKPEEVADLTWQLANSPNYVTGQILGIDGGYI